MTETIRTPRRRSWAGYLLMAGLLAVGLIVAAPTLFSHQPLLGWLMRRILGKVEGTVLVESGNFGWTTPTEITGLKIINPAGEPVLNIARLHFDASLKQILFPSEDLGAIDVDGLELFIIADRGRTNLSQSFPPPPPSTDRSGKPEQPKGLFVTAGARLNINAAHIIWQLGSNGERWRLNPIDIHARIVPAHQTTHGRPELQLPPTVLFDRLELTEAICHDVLRYIAWPMVDVTRPQGTFSLSIADAKLPLGAMQLGDLSGVLTLHTVQFAAGPTIKSVVQRFNLNGDWRAELAHETVIPFQMHQQRIYHQNFQFGLGPVRMETSGNIGFDDTLDLIARIFIRADANQLAGRPVLQALSEQGIRLPITGTFEKPLIDDKALGTDAINLVQSVLQNWTQDKPEAVAPQLLQNLLQKLTQPTLPVANPVEPNAPQVDVGAIIGDAAKALVELRRQRQAARDAAGNSAETPQKPLGKLLDRFRKSTEKPAPEPQP